MNRLVTTCLAVAALNLLAVSVSHAENIFAPLSKVYDVDSRADRFGAQRRGTGRLNTNLLHKLFNPVAGAAASASSVPLQMLDGSRSNLQLRQPQARNIDGIQIVSGIVDGDPNNMATLVRDGSNLRGRVWKNGALYRISGDKSGDYRLSEINVAHISSEKDDLVVPKATGNNKARRNTSGQGSFPRVDEAIDLMIAVTPRLITKMGGMNKLLLELKLLVAETNNIYRRSGATAGTMFRLVGVHNLMKNGFKYLEYDLHEWASDREIIKQRNRLGADLVAFISAPEDPEICGMGYFGPQATDPEPLPELGFSISAGICAFGNLTFAHELGHNLGARHDWYVDDTSGNNHGLVGQDGKWRTVMAYPHSCQINYKTNCPEIPFFSNPEITYKGEVLGVPDDHGKPANNVATISISRTYVAAYRQRRVNTDPGSTTPVAGGGPVNVGGIIVEKSTQVRRQVHSNGRPVADNGKERKIKW